MPIFSRFMDGGFAGRERDPNMAPPVAAVSPAPIPSPAAAPLGDGSQAPAAQHLASQIAETALPPGPGAAPRPARRPQAPNTPVGESSFAQIGSQAAAPFRSANFFQNRAVSGGGDGQWELGGPSKGRWELGGPGKGLGAGSSFATQAMGPFGEMGQAGGGWRRRGALRDLLRQSIMGGA